MARAAIAMLGVVAGCSFTMMNPPPAQLSPTAPPDCTSSRIAPALDVVGAALGAIYTLGFGIAAGVRSDSDDADVFAAVALGSGVVTAIYAASARSGFDKSGRCRAAEAAYVLTYGSYPVQAQPDPPPPPSAPPEPPDGALQGRCRALPAQPCDPGLACISGYCVPQPPAAP